MQYVISGVVEKQLPPRRNNFVFNLGPFIRDDEGAKMAASMFTDRNKTDWPAVSYTLSCGDRIVEKYPPEEK
jgi:hypothetical protein